MKETVSAVACRWALVVDFVSGPGLVVALGRHDSKIDVVEWWWHGVTEKWLGYGEWVTILEGRKLVPECADWFEEPLLEYEEMECSEVQVKNRYYR